LLSFFKSYILIFDAVKHSITMRIFFTITFIFLTKFIFAQEYITEGKKRLNFAKTYFELGSQYTPQFPAIKLTNNNLQAFNNSAAITPYFNFGALHFWGHADFFISIPLSQISLGKKDSSNFVFNQSVATGARYLPWAYKDKKLRPYIGANWVIVNLNSPQTSITKSKIILDGGLLLGNKNFITRLGFNYYPRNSFNYPVSISQFQNINTPRFTGYFGIIYAFETTKSKNMEKVNAELNKTPLLSKPTENAIKNGDFFVGIGPSVSFMLGNSDYNDAKFPYFNTRPISNSFLDVSLGYQFNKLGLITALSYRNPQFKNEGFGHSQTINKKSITLESYKFLMDYSGFTPYLGINLAFNQFKYTEQTSNSNFSKSINKVTPGFTFGWDILPGKTEQWIVLRTNLRWFPFDKINIEGINYSQNQIEYNVIQAVFYPSRFKNAKNKKDKY